MDQPRTDRFQFRYAVVAQVPIGFLICLMTLALPHRLRQKWFQLVAWCAHLPVRAFGITARFLLKKVTEDRPYER